MKKLILSLALIATVQGAVVPALAVSKKDANNYPVRAIRTIKENSDAVQHNAAIYQWERVNLEVDRIAAAARPVRKALEGDSANKDSLATFNAAVTEVRHARLAHEVDRLVDAAQKLSSLAEGLLDKK